MGATGAIPPPKKCCFFLLSCRYQVPTALSVFASKTLGPNPNLPNHPKLWESQLDKRATSRLTSSGRFSHSWPLSDYHTWLTDVLQFTAGHRRGKGAGLQRGSCVHCPAGWVEKLILPSSRNVSWQSVFLRCIYRNWKHIHGRIHAQTFDTLIQWQLIPCFAVTFTNNLTVV